MVEFLQIPLKAFAIAAIRVFKHGQAALAIAAHDGESILERQGFEIDRGELVDPLFGQVAALLGIDEAALKQKIGLGVGVINLRAIDANLIQASHGAFADFVNCLQLRYALGEVFSYRGLLRRRAQAQAQKAEPEHCSYQLNHG